MSTSYFSTEKNRALIQLNALKIKSFMQVMISVPSGDLRITDLENLKALAKQSTIETFGWPIGIFFDSPSEYAVKIDKPRKIYAEVAIEQRLEGAPSYDYWSINSQGCFYLLQSLFEDQRKPKEVFFDTRIIRITEVLMYINKLYSALQLGRNVPIMVVIMHGGLCGRHLTAASPNRVIVPDRKTTADEVANVATTTLNDINSNIIDVVEKFTTPLFSEFQSFSLEKSILTDIVTNYQRGKVV